VTPSTVLPDDPRMISGLFVTAQGGARQGATPGSVGERDTGDAAAFGEYRLLSPDVVRDRVRRAKALMIEILARLSRQRIFACGEPRLGYRPLAKIVRS